jgi:UDP-N-acetylglucosamine/UDP-N-acetylgalactosamine diphosphorylase
MNAPPSDLFNRLRSYRQEHVFAGWQELDEPTRRGLLGQIARIDFEMLRKLHAQRDAKQEIPAAERIRAIPTEHVSSIPAEAARLGEEALLRGEVAVLLVAGGQGSRLGFEKPKGMFPVGPVSGKSLFRIHAEKVRAIRRRYGQPVPFLIMTSPATHDDTEAYFHASHFFALPPTEVFFFQQGTMPALDIQTGKLLLERRGVIFASPDGHGGTLGALQNAGLLDELSERGVKHIFYFQVDNPLVQITEPAFLGRHIAARSQASSKAIAKLHADEKMGVLALIDGRCGIIEYSDMPKALKEATDSSGKLLHRAGNPAIHIFDVDFLRAVARDADALPFHIARKKVAHVDAEGKPVNPKEENALKFERFIFDILPKAERWLVVESQRQHEFAPVKNLRGEDSPETAQRALSNLAAEWLEKVGVRVWRDAQGNAVPVELSPLFALDIADLAGRFPAGRVIDRATYFE